MFAFKARQNNKAVKISFNLVRKNISSFSSSFTDAVLRAKKFPKIAKQFRHSPLGSLGNLGVQTEDR